MDTSLYTDAELRVSKERNQKYLGAAKVKLQQIIPHPSISTGLDSHNVNRLCEIFRKERCRRLDVQNHVTAVVAGRQLDDALGREGLTTQSLMTNNLQGDYPLLDFRTDPVLCLHGQHRLKAGEEVLHLNDQWWIVDLYLDDISPDLQASLIDEYSNERTPSDGEVYRKVRQYQYEANARLESRWMARLSSNKAKRLRQLSSHPAVRAGFDSLLAIPALLLHGMMLGSLPRALAADIPEEMVTGLQNLRKYWSSLFKGDCGKMLRLDVPTVEKLQLLAPGLSAKDTLTVKGLVLSGEVFSNFSESERRSIWKRIKRKRTIIPTLYTFFQDMWYLEACANVLKRLVSLDRYSATVKSALFATFSPPESSNGRCLIQTSESSFRHCPASLDDSKELAYRQLWLYAMRHYLKLGKRPEGDNLIAKQSCAEADQRCLHDMARLAMELGFRSPQIEDLASQSPDHQIARAALLKARGPDHYRYERGSFDRLVRQVVDCFYQAVPIDAEPPTEFTVEEAHLRVRCGFPRRKSQQFDRPFLFLDKIHAAPKDMGKVTTFFVRRCVYCSFFGIPLEATPCTPSEGNELGSDNTVHAPPRSPLFVPQDSNPEPQRGNKTRHESRSRDRRRNKSRKQKRRERHYRQWEQKGHRRRQRHYEDLGMEPHPQTQQSEDIPMNMETKSDHGPTAVSSDGLTSPIGGDKPAAGSNIEWAGLRGDNDDGGAGATQAIGVWHSDPLGKEDHTSDEEMEDEESDEDRSSEDVGTDNEATPLERQLEKELDRLQKEADERGSIDAEKDVPGMAHGQQHLSGTYRATDSSVDVDEELLPAESSAWPRGLHLPANLARTGRPLTRFDFGEAQSAQQGGAGAHHQQPPKMASGTADPEEMVTAHRTTPVNDIPDQGEDMLQGTKPDNGHSQGRVSRPVTQISVETAERGDENAPLDPKQAPMQDPGKAKTSPMPPVISSREVPEGLSDEESSESEGQGKDGMSSTPDRVNRAREFAAAKLDGRSPGPSPQTGSSNVPSGADAVAEVLPQPSPAPGLSTLNDRRERAKRAVTQIDVAPWITGGNESQQENAVRPHPFPDPSAVAPRDDGVVDPYRTGSRLPEETGSSTISRRARKKLIPRIVAGNPRVDRTPQALQASSAAPVKVAFKARSANSGWKTVYELDVDPSDPTAVERLARKDARNRQATFYNKDMRMITPAQCYEAAIEDGTNTIFMDFEGDLRMDEETLASMAREVEENRPHLKRRK
ncbi:hypothetical protein BDV59DRAFT_203528 [Aspergillus ambiguus]|uniref:uncharacterized protein n=1 Tax=Aspergillus ambiguus TaxID=176160 RepID=UPI003CCCB0A7